jgi:glycosyltransferase involved in cell wall biosynthesis
MELRHAGDVQALSALQPELGIIVHSHLRWDFVWQRPQQLLSRIAATNPVLFVEEPVLFDALTEPHLDLTIPYENVVRAVPHLPRDMGQCYDTAIHVIRRLVSHARTIAPLAGQFDRVIQWFYTPMSAPEMLGAFSEEAVVYDCMDELAQFRFAPTDIGRRERLLLSRADVVFTGGYRLFEAKRRHHHNVHFLGCGVDVQHFGQSRLATTAVPADIATLPTPILGYFGVVDERLDYELLRTSATARPDWTVVMIGPVAKVDPRILPQAPNLHWLGQRSYTELPKYLKAFDVCLMPFALNGATEYINPTKTLEYMASGKPIISTPVADVVRNFTPIVHIAKAHTFIDTISAILHVPDAARSRAAIARATESSWDKIVCRMRGLIHDTLLTRATATPTASFFVQQTGRTRRNDSTRLQSIPLAFDLTSGPESGSGMP